MPWLIAILFLAVYESLALSFGWTTLSTMTINATEVWGALPFVAGLAIGMLAAHFWWRWEPKSKK